MPPTTSNDGDSLPYDDLVALVTAMRAMPEGVEIKTRRYHLRSYKKSFLGSDAVRWLIDSGSRGAVGGVFTASRQRALEVGNALISHGLLSHVTSDHDFRDEPLFYRFTADGPPDSGAMDPVQESDGQGSLEVTEATDWVAREAQWSEQSSAEQRKDVVSAPAVGNGTQRFDCSELQQLVLVMQSGVTVKNRIYHLKTYENCFLGSEAVQWLIASDWRAAFPSGSSLASVGRTAAAAVAIGQAMADQGLLAHVTGDHSFKNDELFYRF